MASKTRFLFRPHQKCRRISNIRFSCLTDPFNLAGLHDVVRSDPSRQTSAAKPSVASIDAARPMLGPKVVRTLREPTSQTELEARPPLRPSQSPWQPWSGSMPPQQTENTTTMNPPTGSCAAQTRKRTLSEPSSTQESGCVS